MAQPLVNYIDKDLEDWQIAMVNIIEREFKNAGLSRNLTAAAIVNAYKESRFNTLKTFYGKDYPKTGIKTEDSVGLFMLNSMNGGLGTDMPKGRQYPQGDSRKDPVLNTQRIIRKIKNYKEARDLFAKLDNNLPELTAAFTEKIEVPGDMAEAKAERKALAKELFPYGIDGDVLPRGDRVHTDDQFTVTSYTDAPPKMTDEDAAKVKKTLLFALGCFAVVAALRYKTKGKKPWEL